MKSTTIPSTDSISELAEFWETHDLTDHLNELEEVQQPVFVREPVNSIAIELPASDANKIRELARNRGVRASTLVREWVREKLNHD